MMRTERRARRGPTRRTIVKRKVVSGVLAGIALLTLSAGVAQAGAGGTPFPLTSFFVCDSVAKGLDSSQVVDIAGAHIGPLSRIGVRIGSGILACAAAKLYPTGPRTSCTLPDPLSNPAGTCPAGTGTFCSSIDAVTGVGTCELAPNPGDLVKQGATFKNLKCYSVAVSPRNSGSPPPSFKVTDQLLGTETVQDSGIQFICAPADFTGP